MMCEITAALTIGSAILGYMGQQDQAEQQQESINQETKVRNEELRRSQASQMEQVSLEALKNRAKARVAAGEAGVMGNSVDAVENEIRFNEGQDLANINANTSSAIRGSSASHQRQSNQISRPSLIGTGLQIASAANDYRVRTKAPNPKK